MRAWTLIAVALVGCGSADHGSPDVERAAVAIAWAVTEQPAGRETPDETPSDVCSNCNGKGQVGDGRTMMTCMVCGGSGKPTTSEAASPPPPSRTDDGLSEQTEAAVEGWLHNSTEAMQLAVKTGRSVCFVICPEDGSCGACLELMSEIRSGLPERFRGEWVGCHLEVPHAWAKSQGIKEYPCAWLVRPVLNGDDIEQVNVGGNDKARQTIRGAESLYRILESTE